jgi:hypothetical protein
MVLFPSSCTGVYFLAIKIDVVFRTQALMSVMGCIEKDLRFPARKVMSAESLDISADRNT